VRAADKVAVVYRDEAEARSSGIRLEGHESAWLRLREGKVIRCEWFQGPEDGPKAVGLE
jgi:ketosteroid isomerase-like protein